MIGRLRRSGFHKVQLPMDEPRDGMAWTFDSETSQLYEVPRELHEAALRAFDVWRKTATNDTPSSPEMVSTRSALDAAIKEARSLG